MNLSSFVWLYSATSQMKWQFYTTVWLGYRVNLLFQWCNSYHDFMLLITSSKGMFNLTEHPHLWRFFLSIELLCSDQESPSISGPDNVRLKKTLLQYVIFCGARTSLLTTYVHMQLLDHIEMTSLIVVFLHCFWFALVIERSDII